jgi:flagellar hook assembly protein FlgD
MLSAQRLAIYNQRGEVVWEIEPRTYPAGPQVVQWLGEDRAGKPVASGVYFVKMQALGETFRQRVTLVR